MAAWLGLGLLVAASMLAAYGWSESKGFEQLDDVANRQLDLYVATLESELGQHAYLPSLIEVDPDVSALFDAPDSQSARAAASRKLAGFKVRSSAITTFALGPTGALLASSDGYRTSADNGGSATMPALFSQALLGERSQFFIANSANGASEYYFTQALRGDVGIVGIVGAKVSLAPLEATWVDMGVRSESDKILVLDQDGVVIVSSVPQWKYKLVSIGTPTTPASLRHPEMYPNQGIEPLNLVLEQFRARGMRQVRVTGPDGADQRHIVQERVIPPLGWRVLILSDPQGVWRNARYASWSAGAFGAFFGLLALHLWQRRRALRLISTARNALQQANAQLENKVDQRTFELRRTNAELLDHMHERQLAQDELVQAGKLAVLGQMSAGIAHEINQPLTALRALARNTSLLLAAGRMAEVDENLKDIAEVTERMGSITAQLKSFARKSHGDSQTFAVNAAVQYMQRLLEHRIRTEQVQVVVNVPQQPMVRCDLNRLEQVLINLAGNALDAMHGQPIRVLTITAEQVGQRMVVRVQDSGPGLPDALLGRLFEPFFTTKASGEGLGLGLVISSNIVREFGSSLRVHKGPTGLVFEFDLELAREDDHV